jgi:hypothetical protein
MDEVAVQNLASYKDKKFVDISKEDLDLGMEYGYTEMLYFVLPTS